MAGPCEKSATEVSTSSSSYKPLAKRSAQLLLSPYCWSGKNICEFLRDCWDLVKDDKGQVLKPEIQKFRDELNARALECELWAPFEHWTDFIPDDEFNALMRRNEGTPKPKIDKVDRLLQLIRNKVNHPENDSPHLTTLNWEPMEAGRIDWIRFADYWISKFALLVAFVWSQFICMKTSLSKYYQSELLDLRTDWRKILFSPEELVNELHAEFQKHLNSGFVQDRFEISNGESIYTVELRTLPGEEENLLNAVLGGHLLKRIVISSSAIACERNGNKKDIFLYKLASEIESKKCVTYMFLSLDYKLSEKLYTDLLAGDNEKIIIFTGESAIQSLRSKIRNHENAKNVPLSWRDLSVQKRKFLKKNGRFEIQGRIFRINEILPDDKQGLLSHLEGKELNDFMNKKSLAILQNFQLPEVDKFYQERDIYDPAIFSYKFLKNERHTSKSDVYILVSDSPDSNLVIILPKRKVFPKLKLGKKYDKVYYLRSKIQEVINEIRNFEGCDYEGQVNVHFFEVLNSLYCLRWIATHGSSAVVKRYMKHDSKSRLRMPESYFLYMLDEGFVKNEIIFIANQCGMGKTQFLMKIASKLANERKHIIPSYIFMNDFLDVLRLPMKERAYPTCDDIMTALSSFLCLSKFERVVMNSMLISYGAQNAQKLIMIFDGVDEVKSEMKELALKTLEILHKSFPHLRIIAAVREDAFDKIKGRFGVLGCMLDPIKNPLDFIERYFRERLKDRVSRPKITENENSTRTLRSSESPDLLIPEEKLFDFVNLLDPKPKLVLIYEDLNFHMSPLLMNLIKYIKERKKGNACLHHAQTLSMFFERKNSNSDNDSILKKRQDMQAADYLLIDACYGGLNHSVEMFLEVVRFGLQNLIKSMGLSGKTIWLCLKKGMQINVKELGLSCLELQVLPISKAEEVSYLETFWRENLKDAEEEEYLSFNMRAKAVICLKSCFGLSNKLAGMPLQCRMFAEIFEEDSFKLNFSSKEMTQSSCSHYKMLLRRKYDNWFQTKYANVPVDSLLFKGFRDQFKRALEYLSLKQIFSEKTANEFRDELRVPQKLEKCEELFDAAIVQGILQSKDPPRFTHVSFAEYFVASFLYKRAKKDLPKGCSLKEELKNWEVMDETQNSPFSLAFKKHIKNLISVYSEICLEHVGILKFLDSRLIPTFGDCYKFQTPILEIFISQVKDSSRSPLTLHGSTIPKDVPLMCALYQNELCVVQFVLLHFPKYLFAYFALALLNLDFKRADNVMKRLDLGSKYVSETINLSESKGDLLHWIIIGTCCAQREVDASMFGRIREKILAYSTDDTDLRKKLIERRNSEGQTPLLFLINCMNWYKAPFDMKLYEFLKREFDADVDAVDNEGNSVLHFTFYPHKHKVVELVNNFFTEVFPNFIKFFLSKVKAKHSMNKMGFTPTVNFLLSLDEIRNNGLLSRNDVKNRLKCIKLFDCKKDFYERDEAGNTSINKLIEYLCRKYKGAYFAETEMQEKVNHLDKIFFPELEIDFGTVNNEGKGAIDFAFENKSLVMIKLLEMRASHLFTAARKNTFIILQKRTSQLQEIRIVTSFTIT